MSQFDIQTLNFKNIGNKRASKKSKLNSNQELQEEKDNSKDCKSEIEFDLSSNRILQVTINNLKEALNEKNEEISILKKNFKEKIRIIESENQKLIDNLEIQTNKQLDQIRLLFENKFAELNEQHSLFKASVLKDFKNFQKELQAFTQNHIELNKHNTIVNCMNQNFNEKYLNLKSLFNRKIKEMMNYFDNPEYRILMEKMKYYLKFSGKIDFDEKSNDPMSYLNIKQEEIDILLTKVKVHLIEVETQYLKGLSDIEQKYQEEQIMSKDDHSQEKLENLKNLIFERFGELENITGRKQEEVLFLKKSLNSSFDGTSKKVLDIIQQFKNRKKLIDENLQSEFDFATEFLNNYQNENYKEENLKKIQKEAESDFIKENLNICKKEDVNSVSNSRYNDEEIDNNLMISSHATFKVKIKNEKINSTSNEEIILKKKLNTKESITNIQNSLKEKSEDLEKLDNKKFSMFSSTSDYNPVYEEENFLQFDFPHDLPPMQTFNIKTNL